ncbi:MAG: heavy-metal-associated domain-containing protein [Propionibacteriaceae bacterium]|nr:heavy-metal-associated domain-containing protein [Propionibacteriaceae bacterium]
MITNYTISGITCQHCVRAITAEVAAIPGVERVELEVSGQLTLHSQTPIPPAELEAAIAEAGETYSISGA